MGCRAETDNGGTGYDHAAEWEPFPDSYGYGSARGDRATKGSFPSGNSSFFGDGDPDRHNFKLACEPLDIVVGRAKLLRKRPCSVDSCSGGHYSGREFYGDHDT